MFPNFSGGRQGVSIFNRRRRPRQAVYAAPQSHEPTTPLQIDIPDEALMKIAEDFENSPKNYHHFSSNNKPSSSYQTTRSSSQKRQLSAVSGPHKHPNNPYHGSEYALTKKPKLEQDNYFGEKNENVFRQQSNTCPRQTSISDSFSNLTKKVFSFVEKNTLDNPQQSYSGQKVGQKADYSWNNTNYGTNSPAKATTAGTNARQPRLDERASFGAPMKMMNKNLKTESPVTKHDVKLSSTDTGFTLQTVDKTMKFLTSTIQGVRKWSEYRDKIPLVFEIFVTLDSVPTSNNNGTAKLFNIKDSTGSNRCIYWEMDRKLPRMARGQTYRLVGALERKTGHFQCFTIRQAQLNEQRLAKQQIQMCNDSMTKLIAMISES